MNNFNDSFSKQKLNINAPSFLPRTFKNSNEFDFPSLFLNNFLEDKENNLNLLNSSSQEDVVWEGEIILVDDNSLMKILNSDFFKIHKSKGEEKSIITNLNESYENLSKSSDFLECSMCLGEITREKKFGLLTSCEDIFCYDCIKQWREECTLAKNQKKCPICKKDFTGIIPSEFYTHDPHKKLKIYSERKKRMMQIPCKSIETINN